MSASKPDNEAERTRHLERIHRGLKNEMRRRKKAEAGRRVQSQGAKRGFIAHELHDVIGHEFAGLTMLLDRLAQQTPELAEHGPDDGSRLIARVMNRVRQLSLAIPPKIPDDLGLTRAFTPYLEPHREQTGIDVNFRRNIANIIERMKANVERTVFRSQGFFPC